MPSKKKKFNARFPPARIKKIMQTDEEVGKVAAPVPVIISRALELFIESLILKSSNITKSRHAKTLSTSHIKQTILSEKRFDFLKDLVSNVADVQADEENTENIAVSSRNADSESGHKARGRPRKKKADDKLAIKRQVKRQKKLDDDPDTEETDTATEELVTDEDEDDEDEDDDEDTETDPDTQDSASISATSGRLNTYPQSEASCSTKETATQSHLEQQTQSLDLRINQNKQSSPDQVENKLCTESEDAASLAVTCHRYTQPMQYTRLPLISTQPGAVAFRLGASTVVKAEQDTQSTPPPNTQCVDNSKCKQAAEKTGPGDEQSVRQATDSDENKNDGQTTDVAENRDRSLGSRADESIPCTSTAVSARSGMEPTSSRDSFPMYAGMPPVSMAFYPHHLGVMQQVNPYPAHMRPVPDGMSPYPPGMMPYQAMAFPGHAVLPHFIPMPAMMDSRFEMPRMNSVTTGVQGGFTESPPSGQPPPAHVKQSQQVTPLRQDKSERPTS